MKALAVILSLILISASSCSKPKDHKHADQPKVMQRRIEMKTIRFNEIELDLRDYVEIKLETADPLDAADARFSMECDDPRCHEAVKLEGDGTLKWDGPSFIPATETHLQLKIRTSEAGQDGSSAQTYNLALSIGNFLYQAGDQWTYADDTAADISKFANVIGMDSDNTGHRGATVLYLGRFGGEDLIVTAKHVFDSQKTISGSNCSPNRIFRFERLNITASCKKVVWIGEKNDFAVLAIENKNNDSLAALRTSSICPVPALQESMGHRVVVGGYGRYRNPYGYLKFSADDDCRVLSDKKIDFGSVKSPTTTSNQVFTTYPVIACDGSPGLSGGPLLDRDSGKILGIVIGQNTHLTSRVSSSAIQDFIANKEVESKGIGNMVYLTLADAMSEIRTHIQETGDSDPLLNVLADSFDSSDLGGSCAP